MRPAGPGPCPGHLRPTPGRAPAGWVDTAAAPQAHRAKLFPRGIAAPTAGSGGRAEPQHAAAGRLRTDANLFGGTFSGTQNEMQCNYVSVVVFYFVAVRDMRTRALKFGPKLRSGRRKIVAINRIATYIADLMKK